MDEQLQEDWLDAKLREEAPYIDDAGFTAHVVQQLPRSHRSPRALRGAILLLAALIASVLAFLLAGSAVAESAAYLTAMPPGVVWVAAGLIAMAVMVGGTSLAVVKARDSRL